MGNLLEFVGYGMFKVTASNTLDIKDDLNNTKEVPSVYLKNNTDAALSLKVTTIDGSTEIIKIAPYYIEPLAVKKVFVTDSDSYTAGDVLAYY